MGFWTPMQNSLSAVGQWIDNTDFIEGVSVQGGVRNTNNANYIGNTNTGGASGEWGNEIPVQLAPTYNQEQAQNPTGYDQYGIATGGGTPYAQPSAAALAAQQARRNAEASQEAYRLGGVQSATDTANKYSTDVNSFLDTVQDSQSGINTGRTNNALNTRRSMSSIAGGIRQGLRSGGVQLANMNATDSGAADAMARAYAEMGTQQSNDVNNEASLKENELMTQQNVLNDRKTRKLGEFDAAREADLQRIRGDMQSKLMALDAEASAAGATGAVNMGLVDQIVAEAQQRLSAVDSVRGQRLGGIKTLSNDDVSRQAAEMDAAGTAGTSPFAAPAALGMQQQGAGAPISQLPFYTRRDDQQPVGPAPLTDEDKNRL